jgi:type II secretory pathway component GspD/PulD (secretin)
MFDKYPCNSLTVSGTTKAGVFLLFIFWVYLIPPYNLLYAQSSYQKLQISYDKNSITISARDADLKTVLVKLADKTDTYIKFSNSLKKKITIQLTETSLQEALRRLLKGYNHFILYSGTNKKQAEISGVYVLTRVKEPRRSSGDARQIANRIRSYERQIESLKKRLSGIDTDSRRGKLYMRRIRRLENFIERLKR